MKQSIRIILISILSLATVIGISSFILINLDGINEAAKTNPEYPELESTSQLLSSTGDFLGFYTSLAPIGSSPFPVDVISFAPMNGTSTVLSNSWASVNNQITVFLPTNTSAYDPQFKELVCLTNGNGRLFTYLDNPMNINLINVFPSTTTAPVYLNNTLFGIDVENMGTASGPVVDFDIISINPSNGLMNGIVPLQFTNNNPTFFFTTKTMSSAANGIDEIYFLSGSNLIIVNNPSVATTNFCWLDLAPGNTSNSFAQFYGLEYKSPGVLLAIKESYTNSSSGFDLVEISFNSTTCTINSITSVYDVKAHLPISPSGHYINNEFYSSTYYPCKDAYYISTRYDFNTSSRLIEIDIQGNTHTEQILPEYLFGIEWKQTPCPCEAAFDFVLDSCQTVQFNNHSVGSPPLTYTWFFDDPQSVPNNFSILQNPVHQFSTCGNYNVCMSIVGPGCGNTICHLVQVTDIVPPVAICKTNVVIALDANCIATVSTADIDDGSFDDCQLQSLSVSPNTFNTCGPHPVTLTATDWCGNTSTCSTNVQIVDNIPPAIICPTDLYLSTADPSCSMIVNGLQVITADNCGIATLSYTVTGDTQHSGVGDASGLLFNSGISFITYTATDNCGNSAQCSFNVIVDCSCICDNNLIQNPGFSQGAVIGSLGYGGSTNFWQSLPAYSPAYLSAGGCCDQFSGNINLFGSRSTLYQNGLPFLAGHHYKISFNAASRYVINFLHVGLTATSTPISGSYDPWNCTNCEDIGTSAQIFHSHTTCENYSLPIWTPSQNWDVLVIRPLTFSSILGEVMIDNICVQEIFYSCCANQQEFEENASNLVNIWVDQSEEEVDLNLGSLLACNRIAYIDWGDGTEIIQGPIDANTNLTHIYPDTNIYEIQYLIQEFDPSDSSQVCFEKLFTESVQIEPDSCFCNAFSSMYIRSANGMVSIPLSCNSPAVTLSCPPTGTGYSFTGLFECTGTTCQDTATISWRLSGPHGSEVGLAATNPYFSIDLLPTYFSLPGTYTLFLSGFCGNEVCDCEIQIMVDCKDLCPCTTQNIEEFETSVQAGFTKTIFNNSCKVCFTPNDLTDCETVTWYVNDTTGTPLGSTIGNKIFCYLFQVPDEYSIIMQVDREEASLQTCATFSYEETIDLTCVIAQTCNDNLIQNPFFNEGAMSGNMSLGGSTDQWTAISGSPILLMGTAGSSDDWTIQLTGNLSSADVVATDEPICFRKGIGSVTGKNKVETWGDPHENLNGKHIKDWKGKFVLFQGDNFEFNNCPASTCYEIASIDLSQVDTGWVEFEIEYDLNQWEEATTCIQPGSGATGIEARLAIFVTSPYTNEQGESESRARMEIDELCFNQLTVSVSSIDQEHFLRTYPNPNQGQLVVELNEPATKSMKLRVLDLTGKIVSEIDIEHDRSIQFFNTEQLISGMYFLQLISNNRVQSINKFVKQ